MEIKTVKFRRDGFYSEAMVFGGEEGKECLVKHKMKSALPKRAFLF